MNLKLVGLAQNNIVKKLIALLLVVVLTMFDFMLLGFEIVSYAADTLEVGTATNNKNVTFDSYFKDANGNIITEKEEKINSEDIKLFVQVSVKNDGYFNGTVSLENSNFNLKNEVLSNSINKIEGNTITLNQINSGEVAEIEIGIEPVRDNIIESGLLNMTSSISINGIYRNSKEKDINISATREIKLVLTNPYLENEGMELTSSVITNKIFQIDGKNKRIVQVLVESGLKGNSYPVKETNIELSVPSEVEKVEVISRDTLATNGKAGEEFNSNNWKYVEEEQKVTISIKNEEENNLIKWNKNVKDRIVVTYILDSETSIEDKSIDIKGSITLYDTKSTLKEASTTVAISEEKDGIITTEIKLEEASMYKGKIYSGENREYKVTSNIYVNNSEVEKNINVELLPSNYETEQGELPANIQYSNTVLNKNDILGILGEEGILKISTLEGTEILKVSKETETDENGNIIINYPEGVTAIKVETTAVAKAGTITLKNTKVIKQDSNSRDIKKSYVTLKEKMTESEAKIELKETESVAKLQSNKTSLSTLTENTGVEVTAILKTNGEENDLYTNPNIKIMLPPQVENVTVNSVKLLYEDELQIAATNVTDENGAKVINVNLVGQQTKHKEGNVEGATIIINTNMSLNKKATNSNESIKMTCTNQNTGAVLNIEQPIEVISPRGMVTINSIEDYEMSVIGEEETKTSKLDLGAAAKESTVSIEVINNNNEAVKDVKILGDFPTKNETNTIETTVSQIETNGANAKVYYSENENASENIEDNSNKWTSEITNNSDVKKYLIIVDNMEQSQGLAASYKLNIPEGLQYNEQTYEGYKVIYSDVNTTNEIAATTLGLSTGKGPELKATITAKSGDTVLANGAEVAQGEVIKYEINVENTGSEAATNVNISSIIPEGTVYVEPKEDYIYEDGYYNEYTDKKEATFDIEKIEAGENITKSYEVKVTKAAQTGTKLQNKALVKYGEATEETETIEQNVKEGNLSVTVKRAIDLSIENYSGGYIDYFVIVENISDTIQKDVNVNINLPKELELLNVYLESEEHEEEIGKTELVNLGDINAGEKKYIYVTTKIRALENEDVKDIGIAATVKSKSSGEIKSNTYTETVKNYELKVSLSADNENGYLKTDDTIEYTIRIQNNSNVDATGISIADVIPSQLTVKSISINGENEEVNDDNNILLIKDIEANSALEAKINAVVNYDEERTEPVMISNIATASISNEIIDSSEEVTHILQADSKGANPHGEEPSKNLISGIAWLDNNQDGQRDSDEELLEGINVKLIDISGNIVKDASGNELVTTTNNRGFYIFSNVPQGQYIVVFDYDTSIYATTAYQKSGVSSNKNSDAIVKQIVINGQEGTFGVTDTITMNEEGISNIDIGLMTSTKFDFELNKYISKIVVQTKKETKTYTYNQAVLAKTEIAAKQLQGANVIIEYQIEVKNTGEIAGYVKNIVDYMPSALKFSSELNKDWYQSGAYLYNTSLANTKLEAGETRTIPLTLTKTMTEESTGLINNKAEIGESYNEAGIKDIDSIAANKAQKEDDMGSADVIIGVKTGAMVTYISLTISVIVLIGIGAYFISKKLNKDNDIEVNF